MDDKQFKDLDQFFKSRLERKEATNNGWDVPSDDVLHNALEKLNVPPTRRKRKPIWFWLTGFLVVALSYFLVEYNNEIEKLNHQISQLSELDKVDGGVKKASIPVEQEFAASPFVSKEIAQAKALFPLDNIAIKKEASPINFKTDIKINNSIQSTLTTAQSGTSNLSTYVPQDPIQSASNNNFINSTSLKSTFIQSAVITNESNKNTMELLPALEYLPFINNILNVASTPSFTLLTPTVEENNQESSAKLSSFLTIGHLYSSLQMTNLPVVDYTLTEYDKFYGGWEIGGGMSYKVRSKTKIGASLKYSLINNQSRFNEGMDFDENDVYSNGQGALLFSTDVEINSPTGRHTENLVLDVTDQNLQDGEQLSNQTRISQDFKIISLTGFVNQELFRLSDIRFEIQAGLGLNMISSTNQQMDITMMHDDHEMMSKTITSSGMYDLQKYYLNGQLGLNINKPIAKNWHIGFSTGLNRSLTSIRKTSSSTDPKTYIGSYQTSLNLGFTF